MQLIGTAINLYIYVVLASIILSYFQVPSDHPVAAVRRAARKLVDPVLAPIRKVIRPLPIGGMLLDLSPIILIIGLQVIANTFFR